VTTASRQKIGNVLQLIRQVLRCSTMKSSVDDNHQLKLNALGCSWTVKTGQSICNILRASKSSNRPGSHVEDRLETVK